MNLFLRGDVGVGKSTLVDHVITQIRTVRPLRLGGFMSFRDPQSGLVSAMRAAVPRGDSGAIPVAQVGIGAIPGAFDGPVSELIARSSACELIVFDELGFFERDALAFQESVLRCLDSDTPVLGVLKSREVPWYRRILSREDVTVFEVTEHTRDSLAEVLCGQLGELYGGINTQPLAF